MGDCWNQWMALSHARNATRRICVTAIDMGDGHRILTVNSSLFRCEFAHCGAHGVSTMPLVCMCIPWALGTATNNSFSNPMRLLQKIRKNRAVSLEDTVWYMPSSVSTCSSSRRRSIVKSQLHRIFYYGFNGCTVK